MEVKMFIYVNVDNEGNVTTGIGGTNPVPETEYNYFFIRDRQTLENITKFRVVINDFKPDLALKDGEILEEIKTSELPDGI
ncbi:hypothetical protein GJU41_12070 [Bacillus idriensis]|uniref:Uncharacterized protein n=1 Tax=Metabacillus idriensis TaxID=324768 RepID=A0A6I2M952_9BACI|nr:hypothetical protein [Metabacillus idriensis]MRX54710.1 hypothetical protein [Metabacillus idriensis]